MSSLVLAIEPDTRQAAILTRVVRERIHADITVVDTKDAAVAAINARVPELILVTALLSPRDEEELVTHLRSLEEAEHLQTITIPLLASSGTGGNTEEETSGGFFKRAFRRKKTDASAGVGCDPWAFADQIGGYLKTALEARAARLAARAYEEAHPAAPLDDPVPPARSDTYPFSQPNVASDVAELHELAERQEEHTAAGPAEEQTPQPVFTDPDYAFSWRSSSKPKERAPEKKRGGRKERKDTQKRREETPPVSVILPAPEPPLGVQASTFGAAQGTESPVVRSVPGVDLPEQPAAVERTVTAREPIAAPEPIVFDPQPIVVAGTFAEGQPLTAPEPLPVAFAPEPVSPPPEPIEVGPEPVFSATEPVVDAFETTVDRIERAVAQQTSHVVPFEPSAAAADSIVVAPEPVVAPSEPILVEPDPIFAALSPPAETAELTVNVPDLLVLDDVARVLPLLEEEEAAPVAAPWETSESPVPSDLAGLDEPVRGGVVLEFPELAGTAPLAARDSIEPDDFIVLPEPESLLVEPEPEPQRPSEPAASMHPAPPRIPVVLRPLERLPSLADWARVEEPAIETPLPPPHARHEDDDVAALVGGLRVPANALAVTYPHRPYIHRVRSVA